MTEAERHGMDRSNEAAAAGPSPLAPPRFTDVHCHCLPNLDDGPASRDEALTLCRALLDDGVRTVVATPHQLGRFETRTSAATVREAVARLARELQGEGLDLVVLPGAEVRLDERIGAFLAEDRILTVADRRRAVLLELPGDTFIDIEPLVVELVARNVVPLLVHPERNRPLLAHSGVLERWRACGAGLQVTAASLTGDLGTREEDAAWTLIEKGWVDAIASDAHDYQDSPPRMTAAFKTLAAGLGADWAQLLCVENPSRLVRGEKLISPPQGADRRFSDASRRDGVPAQ
jgi:tyrosine-protein phosphatase YwqE